MFLHGSLEFFLDTAGEMELVHDARDEFHLAKADREILETDTQETLDGQCDDLGISKSRRTAHEFDTALMEFTLTASLRLLITESTADIGELQRLRIIAQTACRQARNRRRHLMAQCHRAVVLIKKLEKMLLKIPVRTERQILEVFNGRRDDLIVSPLSKQCGQLRLDGPLLRCLHGQEVTRTIRDLKGKFLIFHVILS